MKSLWNCFLHIAALNAFAIAQPIFDRLGANPEFLKLEGYSGIAVISSLLIYLLTVPVLVTSGVAVLQWLKMPKTAQSVFATVATLLFAVTVHLALQWLHWRFDLRRIGVPDFLTAAFSLFLAIGGAWLYRRFEWP